MSNSLKNLLMALGLACFIAMPFIPSAFGQSAPPTSGSSSGLTAVDTTNGLSSSSGTVSLAAAGAAQNGAVTTGTQTFAGDKTFSGVLLSSAGTVTAPGIAWSADADGTGTGLYRTGTNEVGVAVNGARALRVAGSAAPCLYGNTDSAAICLNTSVGSQVFYSTNSVTVDGSNITFAGASPRATLGLRLNTSGTAEPTCDSATRGLLWYTAGAGGVADKVQVCAKSAADAYAWRSMATIP